MLFYITKRILMTALVLLLVVIFLSLLVHIVPGDPATTILGPRATPALIQKMREAMDLDKPIHVQIGKFLWNLLHGNLGVDAVTGVPINKLVGSALPHTLILAVSSLSLAIVFGIPMGVYSATHPNSLVDRILAVLSISFTTIPSYVAGLFLLLIFAVELRLLPAMGIGKTEDLSDYVRHLILPSVALAITWIGYLSRLVRTSLLEVLNETYIRASRAAGLSERLVRYRYALKNALIPTVAVLGVGLGSLMGGAVFVEIIFTRPGMGLLIYNAIQVRNYPLVRAGVLIVAVLFILANFIADVVYTYLDPRIQLNKRQG
ncbi:MAG: ABC transporter permease [Chloroflexi bacterium]|nr:MAG: ABC transporter permease [Chloroflexota bacterium]